MKNKNPLYVVKGKDVQEAKDIFDLVIKKLNLEPVVQFIQNILKMILENIKNYPTFIAMKNLLDELVVRYFGLVKKFGLA
jgi:mannitol/fructose-specific phosphotransferase system IIA component (Ntr-type)